MKTCIFSVLTAASRARSIQAVRLLLVFLLGLIGVNQARAACTPYQYWNGHFSDVNLNLPSNIPIGTRIIAQTISVPNWAFVTCTSGSRATAILWWQDHTTPVPGYANMFTSIYTPGIGWIYKENGVPLSGNRTWSIGPNSGPYYYGPTTWTIEGYKIGNISNVSFINLMSVGITGGVTSVMGATQHITIRSVTSTCNVSTTTVTIPLGNVYSDVFTDIGTTSPTSPNYSLGLNCQGSPVINMSVSGTSVPGNTGVFGLAPASNTASGIAVQLFRNGTLVTPGQKVVVGNGGDSTFMIPFAARYIRTGDVSPGSANANMVATFTYN
jgi:type 1 fimbria pilin